MRKKAVKAVAWMKHSMDEPDVLAYQQAQDMAAWFKTKLGTAPPVIAVDTTVDVNKCGPFKSETPSLKKSYFI